MSGERARVLLFAVAPGDRPDAVAAAYHAISTELAGTPGLIGNELLQSTADPREFVVMSEWETLAAFRHWESGAAHRTATSPLRPYQSQRPGGPFAIYTVSAAY